MPTAESFALNTVKRALRRKGSKTYLETRLGFVSITRAEASKLLLKLDGYWRPGASGRSWFFSGDEFETMVTVDDDSVIIGVS